MKIEIKRWDNGKIIICGKYESIKDCLEKNRNKADLSWANLGSANLRSADLRSANLRSANLRSANLRSADLGWANLRSADLGSANLCSADLSSANLDKKYISISRIGSRKDMTTYCFADDIIWCGCWVGNIDDFEKRIKKTHKDNPQYLKEYLGFIKYVKSLKE